MKVLIDATNLYSGGGVQVAVSFISELLELDEFNSSNFLFVLSPVVYEQVKHLDSINSIVIKSSPSKLMLGVHSRIQLQSLSKLYDTVFTIFGPCFWRPSKAYHLVGFANPWLINKNHGAYSLMPLFKRVSSWLKYQLYSYFFLNNSNALVVETKDVFDKLSLITSKEIFVVPNCCASIFYNEKFDKKNNSSFFEKENDVKYLLCLGHTHVHKNYDIVGEVGEVLNKSKQEYKFIFTLGDGDYQSLSKKTRSYSINVGQVSQSYCPALYKMVDGMVLPTLLECFSANYPEAMVMEVPIFTSDRGFSRQICLSHANYFDPLNSSSIALSIIQYFKLDYSERLNKLAEAKSYVMSLPDAKARAKSYLNLIYKKEKINETNSTKHS